MAHALFLKDKNFRRLMTGNAVSLLGSNMQQFALSLYIYYQTGSTTVFASILAISILPRLLLSPVAGVFGDWFNRKKSIVFFDILNSLAVGALIPVYLIQGRLSIPIIYLAVIFLEVTEVFFGSSMSGVVPSMVPKERLLEAHRVRSVFSSSCTMLAPVAGSMLYAGLGLFPILAINSASFFLSALSEMTITIPHSHARPQQLNLKAFLTDLNGGIRVIRENPLIIRIIFLGLILNMCLAPFFSIGAIYLVTTLMSGSEFQYGLYTSSLSLSMIITPVALGSLLKKMRIGRLLVRAFLCVAMIIILIGVIAWQTHTLMVVSGSNLLPYSIILFFSFIIGMLVTAGNISIGTLFDQVVPNSHMGRTSTVMSLGLTVAMPVGQMLVGYALDTTVPAGLTFIILGGVVLAAVISQGKAFWQNDQTVTAPSTAEPVGS